MSVSETNVSVLPEQRDQPLLSSIYDSVQHACDAALARGETLQPPLLAMGVSERVGSNWFLDTLAGKMPTHNEPFRQQLHASHGISSLNPDHRNVAEITAEEVHPYERYWLESFVVSKYTPQQQVIKETNLFFAADNFLSLFPDSRAVVLSRSPVGIASSFSDGNLFERWRYGDRYTQLREIALHPNHDKYGFAFAGPEADTTKKLTRLVVLNTLLLSEALQTRQRMIVPYEDAVLRRQEILDKVSRFILGDDSRFLDASYTDQDAVEATDPTFSTRKVKTGLDAHLSPEVIRDIKEESERLVREAAKTLPYDVVDETAEALGLGVDSYSSAEAARQDGKKEKPGSDHEEKRAVAEYVTDPELGIEWRNTLVTNIEFCDFLNDMQEAGLPNVIRGTQLFLNENMIHERGGRIHFDAKDGKYTVSEGYEEHPVYWVTWLGAESFARFSGARLPLRAELKSLAERHETDFSAINCDYKVGDAVPVTAGARDKLGIFQAVGNLSNWCRDGKATVGTRYIFGTAWNRDGSETEVMKVKGRPVSGNSRSVGIRLVRDDNAKLTPTQLRNRFQDWFDYLESAKNVAIQDKEEHIIRSLTSD